VDHLVGNAWKFTREVPAAVITLERVEGEPVPTFRIRDNGVGFDMAYADKLFQPFQRLHRADEFPGVGIGLAIARRVVERHGGTIRAEGVLGQGAVVTFTLPA
jgi:chemotaxis family two-component system sensor kinase Cph1